MHEIDAGWRDKCEWLDRPYFQIGKLTAWYWQIITTEASSILRTALGEGQLDRGLPPNPAASMPSPLRVDLLGYHAEEGWPLLLTFDLISLTEHAESLCALGPRIMTNDNRPSAGSVEPRHRTLWICPVERSTSRT